MPIAFMAWGDASVGLARYTIRRGRMARVWPPVAMLSVCLVTSLLCQPYWAGALGALVATVAERYRPRFGPAVFDIWDDNWNVVAASLAVMWVLAKTTV